MQLRAAPMLMRVCSPYVLEHARACVSCGERVTIKVKSKDFDKLRGDQT